MSNARFGMVFSTTEDSHYFYDSGTGKVVSCNTQEKKFLEDILNNKIIVDNYLYMWYSSKQKEVKIKFKIIRRKPNLILKIL